MTDMIRRRSLSDSLRWLADKLDADSATDVDRAGVAVTLHALADEIHPPFEPCNAPGDAVNSSGKERCELAAGHAGRHYEGITTWPQKKRPATSEEPTA